MHNPLSKDALYTGDIDWDRIYRRFHDPADIAERINQALQGDANSALAYAGFAETGLLLAQQRAVSFIDHSPFIANSARTRHPSFTDVHTGDITERLASLRHPLVVIACRISAYWDHPSFFERLATSLLAFPRQTVLLDFFDRGQIRVGNQQPFANGEDKGLWTYLGIEPPVAGEPQIFRSHVRVAYSLGHQAIHYEGDRCFFEQDNIARWATSRLKGFKAELGPSLMAGDPSFSLKLARL